VSPESIKGRLGSSELLSEGGHKGLLSICKNDIFVPRGYITMVSKPHQLKCGW